MIRYERILNGTKLPFACQDCLYQSGLVTPVCWNVKHLYVLVTESKRQLAGTEIHSRLREGVSLPLVCESCCWMPLTHHCYLKVARMACSWAAFRAHRSGRSGVSVGSRTGARLEAGQSSRASGKRTHSSPKRQQKAGLGQP